MVKQDKPAIIQEGVIRKSLTTNGAGAQMKGRLHIKRIGFSYSHNMHKQKSTTAKIGDDILFMISIIETQTLQLIA